MSPLRCRPALTQGFDDVVCRGSGFGFDYVAGAVGATDRTVIALCFERALLRTELFRLSCFRSRLARLHVY